MDISETSPLMEQAYRKLSSGLKMKLLYSRTRLVLATYSSTCSQIGEYVGCFRVDAEKGDLVGVE